jgi:hypothetical protein
MKRWHDAGREQRLEVGIKVGTDVLGAVASVAIVGAAAKYGVDRIAEAIAPPTKVQKLAQQADSTWRGSGVAPFTPKP